MGAPCGKRSEFYGRIGIRNLQSGVLTIWHTRDEEPDPVEHYQLCDREWQTNDELDRLIDNKVIVEMLLDKLSDREKEVLLLHHIHEMTLSEIGGLYNVTKERVRQIELAAVRKCKYWTRHEARFQKAMHEHRERNRELV